MFLSAKQIYQCLPVPFVRIILHRISGFQLTIWTRSCKSTGLICIINTSVPVYNSSEIHSWDMIWVDLLHLKKVHLNTDNCVKNITVNDLPEYSMISISVWDNNRTDGVEYHLLPGHYHIDHQFKYQKAATTSHVQRNKILIFTWCKRAVKLGEDISQATNYHILFSLCLHT